MIPPLLTHTASSVARYPITRVNSLSRAVTCTQASILSRTSLFTVFTEMLEFVILSVRQDTSQHTLASSCTMVFQRLGVAQAPMHRATPVLWSCLSPIWWCRETRRYLEDELFYSLAPYQNISASLVKAVNQYGFQHEETVF
jgi:hypothetical protein